MPICVISTVGQSVITNADQHTKGAVKDFAKTGANIKAIQKERHFDGIDHYNTLTALLQSKQHDLDAVLTASAELRSLHHILKTEKSNTNDTLYFLSSETPDGMLAARVLKDFCATYFDRRTEIILIEGLQVKDAHVFRQKGLNNLIHEIYKILASDNATVGTYRRVFNPTGGFKAVVPYLTLIGMVEPDIEISYIYEQSDQIITLGRLPLRLNYDDFAPYFELLEQTQLNLSSEEQLRRELKLESLNLTDHPAWSLFDRVEIDGKAYFELSGLGVIALEHFKNIKRIPVYLSSKASAKFDRMKEGGEQRKNVVSILDILHDKLDRTSPKHFHMVPNDANAPCYKPNASAERAFWWDYGDYILVLELAHHINETDYDVYPAGLKNYSKFRIWEPQNK